MGKAAILSAAILAYAEIEKKEHLEFRYGIIVTVLMFALIGAPLLHLVSIERELHLSR